MNIICKTGLCTALLLSVGLSAEALPVRVEFPAADTLPAEKLVPAIPVVNDTVVVVNDSVPVKKDTVRKGLWRKFIGYFADANKPKPYKKFDFSIIGGPSYSEDTKFGIGLVAAGLYRLDPADSLLPPSDVSLYGVVTTSGFYLVGIKGNTIFPKNKYRLNYNFNFYSYPGYFWGIGYKNGDKDRNMSKFTRLEYNARANFLIRVARNVFIGPSVSYDYTEGTDFERPDLLEGEDRVVGSLGAGFSLAYDSRDVISAPSKGFYAKGEQRFFPSFLGNQYAFSRTDVQFNYYKKAWKGAVIAFDFHGQSNYGDVPWTMLASLGGSNRMRGYYEGRYRDRNIVEAQVELRQHVWRRSGVVFWAGAGNVFPAFDRFKWEQTLPNFGVGYRWEFKNRVNVRLDLGFGRNGSGFIFNINEAF